MEQNNTAVNFEEEVSISDAGKNIHVHTNVVKKITISFSGVCVGRDSECVLEADSQSFLIARAVFMANTGYTSAERLLTHRQQEVGGGGGGGEEGSRIHVISPSTLSSSSSLVTMTMVGQSNSQTILQKSARVLAVGPWEAMYWLARLKPCQYIRARKINYNL